MCDSLLEINLFLFIKNKWLFIASEGFSTLDKKSPDTGMLSEGNAAHPVRRDSPLLDSNGSLAPFLFEFKLSRSGVTALSNNNGALKGHFYLQRAVTPNQITQQNSLQRAVVPQGQKRHFEA
jgi:hypothetical protein